MKLTGNVFILLPPDVCVFASVSQSICLGYAERLKALLLYKHNVAHCSSNFSFLVISIELLFIDHLYNIL